MLFPSQSAPTYSTNGEVALVNEKDGAKNNILLSHPQSSGSNGIIVEEDSIADDEEEGELRSLETGV